MAIRGFWRTDGRDFADDSFAMWTPIAQGPPRQGQLVRADVLEATLVSYASDWDAITSPGEAGAFGTVERRWSRAGGQLARAQLLEIRSTQTFHYHGPHLDTLLRIHPTDGRAPFDVRRSMTVPMNYLALLHRTKQLVVRMGPRGRSYDIDWERTNLLAGTSPAVVISPHGHVFTLTGRADLLLTLMRLLASHAVDHLSHMLDLRNQDPAVAARVMDAIQRAPGL
ncbi:hypothetical protein [Streptomyces scopuliridis]|uniref:Uncharacterized protein n=1 Tax=Streptomyces scopuliridis RB72 TaxID=1440053 RepID=A0A2T7TFC8_9ACTN|nr:hypothetical protein [Streptomyces scopuliridis]PVE13835.1 hypothetical protein Y717_07975 [Streptomyces scopuliridis RB72]